MSNPDNPDRIAALAELLTRASWRVRRSGKAELAAQGITFAQARALRYIVRSTSPLRMNEIATKLEVVPRSATTSVDVLEATKLVERKADPADRRSILVSPTKAGRALIDRIDEERRRSADVLFSSLTAEEQEGLYATLGKICSASLSGTAIPDIAPHEPSTPDATDGGI